MPSVPEADLDHILAHTGDLWETVRGQNLFVTGGTGFFGRWLVESFAFANARLDLGAHMTILTRDPAAFAGKAPALARNPRISLVAGDIRTLRYQGVIRHIPSTHSGRFHHVIHAATDSVGQTDPIVTFNTIVNGTRAALDFAVATGATRFLFTSSGAVYGPQPSDLTHIPETYPGAPDCSQAASAYGEGKRAAELLCACYHARHPSLQPVIARCFAFVGPFLPLDAHFAIGNFIRDALRGGPIQIAGDGSPYRSYLYAADLAVWLWHLLFRGEPGIAYNVGSDADLDIEALAKLVANHSQPPREVIIAGVRTPGEAPARYVPDVTRITQRLGLPKGIGLDEAISRTLSFHQSLAD
jgi:dTDP-glucose 4,6-dehydratase